MHVAIIKGLLMSSTPSSCMLTTSDHCALLPLNQITGMGFGMLCRVPTAEEFLMGLVNEYSKLDAWARE